MPKQQLVAVLAVALQEVAAVVAVAAVVEFVARWLVELAVSSLATWHGAVVLEGIVEAR